MTRAAVEKVGRSGRGDYAAPAGGLPPPSTTGHSLLREDPLSLSLAAAADDGTVLGYFNETNAVSIAWGKIKDL